MGQNTFINGSRYQFSSLDIVVNGVTFPGTPWRSINYTAKKDAPKVYGNNVRPVGRTRGQLDCSGSAEILASEFDDLMNQLEFQGLFDPLSAGILDLEFNVIITMEENFGSDFRMDQLIGCRITNVATDNAQGTEPIVMKFDLSIMEINYNGNSTVGDTIGANTLIL